jgi:hypothetical protein
LAKKTAAEQKQAERAARLKKATKEAERAAAAAEKASKAAKAAAEKAAKLKGKAREKADSALERARAKAEAEQDRLKAARKEAKLAKDAANRGGVRTRRAIERKQTDPAAEKVRGSMRKNVDTAKKDPNLTKAQKEKKIRGYLDGFDKWLENQKKNKAAKKAAQKRREAAKPKKPKLAPGEKEAPKKTDTPKKFFQGTQVLRGQPGGPSVMRAVYTNVTTSAAQAWNAISRHPAIQGGGKVKAAWIENENGEKAPLGATFGDPYQSQAAFIREAGFVAADKGWLKVSVTVEV